MSTRPAATAATVAIGVAGVAAGILGWWLVVALVQPPAYVLPAPGAVAGRLLGNPGLYLESALQTLRKVLVGGSIGVVVGLGLGSLIAHHPLLRRTVMPYLITMRVLPKIAIAPVLLIYLGLGFRTAVLFVAVIAVFPVVISTVAGFERVPDRQLDLLRSVDASPVQTFLRVRVPYAVPDLLAGIKQAVALSVVGAVVAEWVVSTEGLGYIVLAASERVQPAVLVAALVLLVALGLGIYAAVHAVQRLVVGPLERFSGDV